MITFLLTFLVASLHNVLSGDKALFEDHGLAGELHLHKGAGDGHVIRPRLQETYRESGD